MLDTPVELVNLVAAGSREPVAQGEPQPSLRSDSFPPLLFILPASALRPKFILVRQLLSHFPRRVQITLPADYPLRKHIGIPRHGIITDPR